MLIAPMWWYSLVVWLNTSSVPLWTLVLATLAVLGVIVWRTYREWKHLRTPHH